MAYIGVQPADAYTSFAVQHFTTSATTSYTLDNPVANENEIALFINNVRQEPGSSYAYTASGTALTLSAATSASDTMYCVFIGKAVQTVTPAVGSVTNDMLSGSIATSKLANQNIGFRNLIINGDMSIAQRGTSVTGSTSSGYLTVDRWNFARVGGATFSHSQTTDVPTGQGFANSYKIESTTGDGAMGASELNLLAYYFEAQNLNSLKWGTGSAESVTLSFWVKATVTGTYIVEFYNNDNSGDQLSASYTINSANTWEKKTITVVGYTSGAFGNDNNTGMQINWWLGAGSDFQSGSLTGTWRTYADGNRAVGQVNTFENNNNTFYLTGVQLEVGTSASDFEFLPYDVNLRRCQRYFYRQDYNTSGSSLPVSHNYSTGNSYGVFYMPVMMRAKPTLAYSSLSHFLVLSSLTASAPTGFAIEGGNGFNQEFRVDRSGLSQGGTAWTRLETASATLDLDAEL